MFEAACAAHSTCAALLLAVFVGLVPQDPWRHASAAVNGQTRGAIGSDQLLSGNVENPQTGGLQLRVTLQGSQVTAEVEGPVSVTPVTRRHNRFCPERFFGPGRRATERNG